MAECDDDPVVEELDVHLSKTLADHLYLFQYPARPSHLPYDSITHLAAKIKPKQQKVELELAVNTRSSNYSYSKGEQIALNVDGYEWKDSDKAFFNSDLFDKQMLCSTPSALTADKYTVAILKQGELHLAPLRGMVQLHPAFRYLDQADSKHKADLAASGDAADDEDQEEPEDDAKKVMVRFARPETEEAKARREASYDFITRKREEEPWHRLLFYPSDSDQAEAERQRLYASHSLDPSEFQMSRSEYLTYILPHIQEEKHEEAALPVNVLSLNQLKVMPLQDQVRALLINAKTIRFSQLMTLLPQNTDPTSALRCVQQVAALVQGSWVLKSEILYPKDTVSASSGVGAEALCRGRDYVMWKFTQSRFVIRKDITSTIKLPAEDVKDILEQMSRIRANCGWEFMYLYDKEFTDRHPEIVQRQRMLWDVKYQTLGKQLKLQVKELDKKPGKEGSRDSASPEKSKRQRTPSKSRTRTLSGRSLSDMSDNDIESAHVSDSAITPEKEKKSARFMSDVSSNEKQFNRIFTSPLRTPEKQTADKCVSQLQTEEAMDGIDSAIPVSNGSIDMELSNTNSCESDKETLIRTELCTFALEKLQSRNIFPLNELKRLFALKLAQCQPGHILGCGVSDKMLEQGVLAAGGVVLQVQMNIFDDCIMFDVHSHADPEFTNLRCIVNPVNPELPESQFQMTIQWPPGSHQQPLFALTRKGDGYDEWRTLLVDMFKTSSRIKSSTFRRKIEGDLNASITDNECKKFLKDYCLTKGGLWYLKGTCPDDS